MRFGRSAAIVAATLSVAALTSCGTSVVPGVANNFIDGDWNLTGNATTGQLPAISGAFQIVGNQVSGTFYFAIQCTSGLSLGIIGSQFTGPIGPADSFTLTQRAVDANSPFTGITITGTLPATAESSWSGTYSITGNPRYCSISGSGTFTASRFAPLTGDYAGTVANSSLGSSVSLAASLVQATAPADVSDTNSHPVAIPYFPLTGSITVTGSPCFTQGTAVIPPALAPTFGPGVIGSYFAIEFTMDDGSTLSLTGNLAGTSATQLGGFLQGNVNLFVLGGNCNGTAVSLPLTLQ